MQTPLLERAILETLAYFDIFDHPLTATEILRYLWQYPDHTSMSTLLNVLDEMEAKNSIDGKGGYFFLPGRQSIIRTRERAVRDVEKKLCIARRACALLRYLPFLRAVFVCNTVAAGHPEADSDIDVFIVVRHGRLWLTRLFTTLLLSMFRLRRNARRVTDRICLSFYVTDESLDLSPIAISQPDIYLIYWISQLIPIYDPGDVYTHIHTANTWTKKYTPHAFTPYMLRADLRVEDTKRSRIIKNIFEKLWNTSYGDLIESQAKGVQKAHMKAPGAATPSPQVIVSDTMLKFHENDRRAYYFDLWKKRLGQLNV